MAPERVWARRNPLSATTNIFAVGSIFVPGALPSGCSRFSACGFSILSNPTAASFPMIVAASSPLAIALGRIVLSFRFFPVSLLPPNITAADCDFSLSSRWSSAFTVFAQSVGKRTCWPHSFSDRNCDPPRRYPLMSYFLCSSSLPCVIFCVPVYD